MKKVLAFLLCVLLLGLCACRRGEGELEQVYVDEGPEVTVQGELKDVAILFTAGLAQTDIRELAKISALWVTQGADYGRDYLGLVDCGGAIDPVGEETLLYDRLTGMSFLGYQCAAVDSREMFSGAQRFLNVANAAEFDWLCGNLTDTNAGVQPLAAWTVMDYGAVSVGYVGVCEPVELTEADVADGGAKYSLRPEDWTFAIRDAAADARAAGVDYVVVLGSLGEERAAEMLAQSREIDVYLDGSGQFSGVKSLTDKDGEAVFAAGIAGGAGEVGKLIIATDGSFSFESITGFTAEDEMALQMLRDMGYDAQSAAPEAPAE